MAAYIPRNIAIPVMSGAVILGMLGFTYYSMSSPQVAVRIDDKQTVERISYGYTDKQPADKQQNHHKVGFNLGVGVVFLSELYFFP